MKVEIVCLIVLMGVATTYSLRCYVCEGKDSFISEDDCGDKFETEQASHMLTMCNSTQKWCKKEKFGANNIWTKVKRSCASECEEENIIYVDRTVCCNDKDGCNTAAAVGASAIVCLVTALLTFF